MPGTPQYSSLKHRLYQGLAKQITWLRYGMTQLCDLPISIFTGAEWWLWRLRGTAMHPPPIPQS